MNEIDAAFSTVSCKFQTYMIYLVDKYENISWVCYKVENYILISKLYLKHEYGSSNKPNNWAHDSFSHIRIISIPASKI